jgi:outer membrane protein assembly factor BamA
VKSFRALPLVFLLLVGGTSPAQRQKTSKELPPSAFKLITVQVSGTRRYKPEDVIRASGLQLGQTVHEDDFKDAARRLGQSGAFTSVAYSFDYSPEGTKLELQVKDAEHFAPVRFENLVWFSDQELLQKLHAEVPLFNGELPVTGPLPDDVTQALQAMVDAKKIAAQVNCVRVAHGDGPTEAFAFSVTGPRILIHDVDFSGASSAELPTLEAAGRKLRGAEYERSALRLEENKSFLPVFLEGGYLKATFGEPEAKVAQSDQDEVLVDLTFPVEPGPQYRLTALEIDGNRVISTDAIRKLIQTQLGQPADAIQINKDAESVNGLYGTKGYMDATVRTEPKLDDSHHTVRYRYVIREGDIYQMGDLEILGVDSRTKDRLQNNWTLLTGDTYNSGYTRRFVSQALKEVLTTGEWDTDIQETLDRKGKTVDVTLRFVAKQ